MFINTSVFFFRLKLSKLCQKFSSHNFLKYFPSHLILFSTDASFMCLRRNGAKCALLCKAPRRSRCCSKRVCTETVRSWNSAGLSRGRFRLSAAAANRWRCHGQGKVFILGVVEGWAPYLLEYPIWD